MSDVLHVAHRRDRQIIALAVQDVCAICRLVPMPETGSLYTSNADDNLLAALDQQIGVLDFVHRGRLVGRGYCLQSAEIMEVLGRAQCDSGVASVLVDHQQAFNVYRDFGDVMQAAANEIVLSVLSSSEIVRKRTTHSVLTSIGGSQLLPRRRNFTLTEHITWIATHVEDLN